MMFTRMLSSLSKNPTVSTILPALLYVVTFTQCYDNPFDALLLACGTGFTVAMAYLLRSEVTGVAATSVGR